MNITFAPRGILQIDDARIIHRNFSGIGSKFNREGDRNFSIIIEDEEQANALIDEGWNVKIKAPKDEESIDCLDNIDIISVDIDIRPYEWEVNGKSGRTAYLQSMSVTQNVDRFAIRYSDDN